MCFISGKKTSFRNLEYKTTVSKKKLLSCKTVGRHDIMYTKIYNNINYYRPIYLI